MANIRNYLMKIDDAMSVNGILNGCRTSMHRQTIDYSFAERTLLFAKPVTRKETVTPKTSMLIETLNNQWLLRLKKLAHYPRFIILTVSLLATAGCSGPTPNNASAPAPP